MRASSCPAAAVQQSARTELRCCSLSALSRTACGGRRLRQRCAAAAAATAVRHLCIDPPPLALLASARARLHRARPTASIMSSCHVPLCLTRMATTPGQTCSWQHGTKDKDIYFYPP
eukprot:SAG11_NODE_1740_length_4338_cov_2.608634_8_plen_117_part_00